MDKNFLETETFNGDVGIRTLYIDPFQFLILLFVDTIDTIHFRLTSYTC